MAQIPKKVTLHPFFVNTSTDVAADRSFVLAWMVLLTHDQVRHVDHQDFHLVDRLVLLLEDLQV